MGLTFLEKKTLEELFEMQTGYVLDFSNASFAKFVGDSINLGIYNDKGYEEPCSKANKLRQIWNEETERLVGKLLIDLLSYTEDYLLKNKIMDEYKKKKIDDMRFVAKRLLGNVIRIDLPPKKEDNLQTLTEDINSALERNQPGLELDRLHTFSTTLLRQICEDNGINVKDNKDNYLPLHSLAGSLSKHYEKNSPFQSEFTVSAIKNCISLFDKYNGVRNNQSFAHDNEVLDGIEAEFVVKTMASVITFLDAIEKYRKKVEKAKIEEEVEFDIPF